MLKLGKKLFIRRITYQREEYKLKKKKRRNIKNRQKRKTKQKDM